MNINMSDFFKNNISSGSQTTDVNVSENVSHESVFFTCHISFAECIPFL